MTPLFTSFLGLDPNASAGARWSDLSIRWVGLPTAAEGGWWSLATLALVAFLLWHAVREYRREGAVISAGVRRVLTSLRLGALAVALAILFQPTLVIDRSERLKSTAWLLVDDSLSMGIEERGALGVKREASRLEQVKSLVTRHSSLATLAATHQLRLAAFSDGWRELATSDFATLKPQGAATSLANGLRQTIENSRGQPVAAVVLVSDGQATDGETMAAAQFAAQRGVPVFVVGVGNPKAPRNIEVASLTANPVLFKDDEAVFTARVLAKELAGTTAKVTLREEGREALSVERQSVAGEDAPRSTPHAPRPTSTGRIVVEQTIKLPSNNQPLDVTLRAQPQQLGTFTYAASIAPLADELTDRDNSASFIARVIAQKPRVLFIAGNAGKEYRYLKNHLTRDTTLSVSCWLQSADAAFNQEGDAPLTTLPKTEQELFGYDVIVMLDPDPREFDAAWAKLLARFVGDHGGGLAFIASNKFTTDFLMAGELRPIADLLPVQIEREQLTVAEALSRVNQQDWPWLVTAAGFENPVFQLDADPERNRRIWAAMPGFYWAQPVRALKPGATALAVHSDPRRQTRQGPQPVVATQFYGPGRVLFVASDSTWRWRFGGARAFEQFWSQAVRYLTQGRLLGGMKRLVLTTDHDEYSLGQRITVRAKALDASYKPAAMDYFEAQVKTTSTAARVLRLDPIAGAAGEFEGSLVAEQLGLCEINASVPGGTARDAMALKTVRVTLPRLEFKDTRMNESLLRQIATATGGEFLTLDRIGELPGLLPKREQLLVNEQTQDIWDTPLALCVFCGLLFTEWTIRKWKNLA
ncbi:MAG: VWA domain-containing protein [Verrucomicrobia bacterium]|nr:VWA domain-containing protein [Verrucomicrobiota bacterium]